MVLVDLAVTVVVQGVAGLCRRGGVVGLGAAHDVEAVLSADGQPLYRAHALAGGATLPDRKILVVGSIAVVVLPIARLRRRHGLTEAAAPLAHRTGLDTCPAQAHALGPLRAAVAGPRDPIDGAVAIVVGPIAQLYRGEHLAVAPSPTHGQVLVFPDAGESREPSVLP